jgi:hypothetical protein
MRTNEVAEKHRCRRPREDLGREVPRGAGGTSVYARTRAHAAVVRRRRVTTLVKTQIIMRGHIEGASEPVNIVGYQYCERATQA